MSRGFYPSMPKPKRADPLHEENWKPADECFESDRARLAGVNHAANWKPLKKKTIIEMVLKCALERNHLDAYVKRGTITLEKVRSECIKQFDYQSGQGRAEAMDCLKKYKGYIF